MVADIKSEPWPASFRNQWPASIGIRTRGRLHLRLRPGDDYTPAFTADGIERLRELSAELSQLDLPLSPK